MIKVYIYAGRNKIGEGVVTDLFIDWFKYSDPSDKLYERVGDSFLQKYILKER
jgi:hypothetical protein